MHGDRIQHQMVISSHFLFADIWEHFHPGLIVDLTGLVVNAGIEIYPNFQQNADQDMSRPFSATVNKGGGEERDLFLQPGMVCDTFINCILIIFSEMEKCRVEYLSQTTLGTLSNLRLLGEFVG